MTHDRTFWTQRYVLTTAVLASSMAFIDSTALNVALPALQRSMGLTGVQLLWVVNAYTLFLASLMLIGGSLGDAWGKRKIFMVGIATFTVFSACCGLSVSGEQLILFRALQGVGGAIMVPGSLSLLSSSFPSDTRGKAIGTWSMFSALTTVFGPALGGYLAELGWWRAIFFINVPLGLLSLLVLWTKIKEPVAPTGQSIDWSGATLGTLAFGCITFGFLQGGDSGFDRPLIYGSLLAGVVLLALFLFWEHKSKRPMMPLSLFRSVRFSGANLITLFVYAALSGVLFFVPLNLIQIQHYPEGIAGLAMLPFGASIAIMGRISGSLTDRIGPRIPLISGPLITGLAFFSMAFIGLTEGASDFMTTFFPALLIGGIGMGITVVPLTTVVMNSVSDEDTGKASGVNNTVSRLSGLLAIAIFGAVALLLFQHNVDQLAEDSPFTAEQIAYVSNASQDFADAQPDQSWSQPAQTAFNMWIDIAFIRSFNLTCYLAGALCLIGALMASFFFKDRPTD